MSALSEEGLPSLIAPCGPKNELTPRRLPAPPSARSHAFGTGRNGVVAAHVVIVIVPARVLWNFRHALDVSSAYEIGESSREQAGSRFRSGAEVHGRAASTAWVAGDPVQQSSIELANKPGHIHDLSERTSAMCSKKQPAVSNEDTRS
jgi:hypothetical protein